MKIFKIAILSSILISTIGTAQAENDFNFGTRLLKMSVLNVHGETFRNVEVMLKIDGTYLLYSAEAPVQLDNPVCDIDRETARQNALADAREDWGSDYSMVQYVLNKDMDAYDDICAMEKSAVYLEVLNEASSAWYPDFSMVKYSLEKDLEAYKDVQ
ncbi:hypothetical protein BMR03_09460 [Methylococcaceae bacterium HT2]|nr:hypothetical protein BMR03_09460 [Methylococcaceae bacterium HT2]